ncbi:kinetochore-associated Ndc80 complex subunit NUF2 TDEL_0D04730 [Torulaspora delbrueckii]|uniref:Kinetochore protein Nuf2 N-terminal domain-containing protein n=1 Tax=Torulaspora delbrueckii TaxID=4950 RepID=G8ZTW3_TORDE|nr:hypothetical protein TDEL_0D04730 [Torulaspora delbrueckii]CCE92057.1 hypothetical protein TDEL_0D04730 [Torulaspora delbrueckii]
MSADIFPLLDYSELAICLQSCDFSLATEENIARPTSQFVITLYKQIIDSFMGISSDALLKKGQEHINDATEYEEENEEAFYSESLQVLVLNKICYKFFQNIGVSDFNMMDLYRPDTQRTKRLLSAVVNYARFREERMFDCNRFISQTEALLGQLRSKFDEYNLLQQQMKRYEEEEKQIDEVGVQSNGDELEALESNNRSIETQLKKLTQIQETLSIDYNNYKEQKQRMLKELETLGFQIVELDSQWEKLEKYAESNMDELERSIEELGMLLEAKQQKLSQLEHSQENLRTSAQTFQRVIEELYGILQIVSVEIQNSHRKEEGLVELKRQLALRHSKVENILTSWVMVKLSILEEQLEMTKKQLTELTESSKNNHEANAQHFLSLQQKYTEQIMPEIQEAEMHIEKDLMVGEVKKLEGKMHRLQVEFQQEVEAIDMEYSLLAGHMNKYLEVMLEKMN